MIRSYEVKLIRYSVVCASCDEEGPSAPSETEAARAAQDEGWWADLDTGEWSCPECQRDAEQLDQEQRQGYNAGLGVDRRAQ